jgi:predicted RNA-binding protein YlxR (DUF448 family)
VRIARATDGRLAIGPGPGRGAWLCAEPDTARCLDQAVSRGALGRALRSELTKVELAELHAKLLETDAATKRVERAKELASERTPAGRVTRPEVSERE